MQIVKRSCLLFVLVLFAGLLMACGDPTATPVVPTAIPQPTATPVPPTATPIPATATPAPSPTPTGLSTGLGDRLRCNGSDLMGQAVNIKGVRATVTGVECLATITDKTKGTIYRPKNGAFLIVVFKVENNSNSQTDQLNIIIQDSGKKNYILADTDAIVYAWTSGALQRDRAVPPGKTGTLSYIYDLPASANGLALFTM